MSQAVHHLGLIKQELPSAVQILAVSKNHPTAAIKPLLEIGHRQFAENKVQEAADKWPALKAQYPDICLSMIGHLQTNKADQAVQIFDEIQSLDRPKLADAHGTDDREPRLARPCPVPRAPGPNLRDPDQRLPGARPLRYPRPGAAAPRKRSFAASR